MDSAQFLSFVLLLDNHAVFPPRASMRNDEVLENAWVRSKGRCECPRTDHGHGDTWGRALVWEHRGATTSTSWILVRRGDPNGGGWHAVQNAQPLCAECSRRV